MKSDAADPAPARASKRKEGGIGETTRFLLGLFLFALVLRSFIVSPFSIPSGSMLPTMMIGDYLFVSKFSYGFSRHSLPFGIVRFDGRMLGQEPERGDVVVFRYPGSSEDYVKRLVGLPGDQIQMRAGILHINGEQVPRTRVADYLMPVTPNSPCRTADPEAAREVTEGGALACAYDRYRETLPNGRSYYVLDQTGSAPGDNTPAFLVPEGHYFMMGDNRDDSMDSRFALEVGGVGFLHKDQLIGEALIAFFSTNGAAEWLKPWTWFTAARWNRIGETY